MSETWTMNDVDDDSAMMTTIMHSGLKTGKFNSLSFFLITNYYLFTS